MQIYTASQTTMNPSSKPVETYTTLWSADGTYASTTAASAGVAPYLQDGSTSTAPSGTYPSQAKLFTLNSSILSTQKFAFEATFFAGSGTASCALYDMTSSAMVNSSVISTTSTTATVVRSAQITLTPGHTYGVAFWNSGTCYMVDASLITFP